MPPTCYAWLCVIALVSSETFNTDTENQYENAAIICTEGTSCVVICDEELACSNATINAQLSSTLFLTCSARNSCKDLTISHSAQQSTQVRCTYSDACASTIFNLTNSALSTVDCDYDDPIQRHDRSPWIGPSTTVCSDMQVFAGDAQNLTVSCAGYHSCREIKVHAANVTRQLSLTCDGLYCCDYASVVCPVGAPCHIDCSATGYEGQCESLTVYIDDVDAQLQFASMECPSGCDDVEFRCSSGVSRLFKGSGPQYFCENAGYECCPLSTGYLKVCGESECVVNCTSNAAGDCDGNVIDGSLAASLTVHCDVDGL